MQSGPRTQPSAGPAELITALREAAAEAALGLFRRLLASAAAAPGLLPWLHAAWAAFSPGGTKDGFEEDLRAARSDEAAAALLLARAAFGAGHEACAVALVRGTMAGAPTLPAPTFLLCAMLLRQGNPESQDLLRRCLQDCPEPSRGWTVVGDVLLGLGKKEAAMVCFARGAPGFELALRRGLLARDLGRLAEARRCFEDAVRMDGASPRAWFLLGTAVQDMGALAAAADAYRTVLALDPARAEAAVNLGTVLQEAGDLQGAKAAYGRAVVTRSDTFGRVAQALTTSARGELWLDLDALRRSLLG